MSDAYEPPPADELESLRERTQRRNALTAVRRLRDLLREGKTKP